MSEPTGTQYGGFWVRFLAFLADSAIVFVISSALFVGAALALAPGDLTLAVIAIWILGFLYWPVLHASRLNATFGKAILGLRVSRFDGRRISFPRALWREIAKIFSGAVFMLGYVIAAVTPRKQALHDLMAATYVSREGVSRVFPAVLVALAGFATPVFVAPMLVAPSVMAGGREKRPPDPVFQNAPRKDPPRPGTMPATKAPPRKPTPAPTPAAKAPAPAPVAKAPEAPKVDVPIAEPAKPVIEPAKPATEAAKTLPDPAKTAAEPAKTMVDKSNAAPKP